MAQTDTRISGDSEDYLALGKRTMAKLAWRVLPFLCLLYVFNILDRINIGFARTTMQKDPDLGLTQAVIDWGFGLFYVGYLVFEVPSNLILKQVGARLWIARIMITWGVISTATMWVNGPSSFYLVRILLGIAEAGFFPGIILYLTAWFPKQQRARATSWFMIAITFASIFGNPISGAILENCDGLAGWKGWQWLFLLEGLPTIFIGCLVPFILQDKPADAKWLAPEERAWLEEELEREDKQRTQTGGGAHWSAMLDWRVLLLIVLYSSVAIGTNGMGAYLPTLVKERFDAPVEAIAGVTPGNGSKGLFRIGLLSALPHLSALFAMVIMSRISDKTGWRSVLVAFVAFASGLGWLGASQAENPNVALACLCVAQAGMMAMLPIFWTLPPLFLGGTAAAGGIALINSVANIGGIFAATLLGKYGPVFMFWIMTTGAFMAILAKLLIEGPAKKRIT